MSARNLPFAVPNAILDKEVKLSTESHLFDLDVWQEGAQQAKRRQGKTHNQSSAGSGGEVVMGRAKPCQLLEQGVLFF